MVVGATGLLAMCGASDGATQHHLTIKSLSVLQAHDVTSSDPRLLVFLKAYRNTVPVPRHWCAKRKYLQGKRGIERPPFELPGALLPPCLVARDAALRLTRPPPPPPRLRPPLQSSSRTRASRRFVTRATRRRRRRQRSSGSATRCSPRWGRSTSTTRSCTTPSSSSRPSPSSPSTVTCAYRHDTNLALAPVLPWVPQLC